MKERTFTRIFQNGTRLFIVILVTYFAVMHQLKGVLGAPNAHVFCPFGGLETLYKFLAGGGYIKKIFPATMILFVVVVVLTIVLNRAFCGWICPLGTLQSLFDRIGRFFKIKKVQVPPNVEKYLSYIKYAILVVALYFTWRIGDLVYGPYDPWAAYTHIAGGFGELYDEFLIGSIFLLVGLIGSLWLPNNFCRYFCPMGAFLSIFSKLSPTRIHRNQETCINCKKCDKVCPAQIEISTKPNVSSTQCLACGDCINTCPVDKTLFHSIRGKLPLRWLVYGIAVIAIFFVPVFVTKHLGVWKTNFATAQEVVVDESGALNPYNIRGSMTLEEVAHTFQVPAKFYLEKLNLPEDLDKGRMLRDLGKEYNFEAEIFRELTAEYLQQQQPEQIREKPVEQQSTGHDVKQEESLKSQTAVDIRGKTTMGELLDYGLTKEQFKEAAGIDMPDDMSIQLKDFAAQNGLEREVIREKIIEILQH